MNLLVNLRAKTNFESVNNIKLGFSNLWLVLKWMKYIYKLY